MKKEKTVTEKKATPKDEKITKQNSTCACTDCSCQEGAPEIESAEEENLLSEIEVKCAEYKDIAQRVKAEFENYRKRTQEEARQLYAEGANCVLCDLLNINDNFDRALAVMKDGPDKEGVELIKKQLETMLAKYEVQEIPTLDEVFNPDLHNAVMQVEDEERAGQVVEVLQKGFIRANKVLRYAMVKVAK